MLFFRSRIDRTARPQNRYVSVIRVDRVVLVCLRNVGVGENVTEGHREQA
jgi:hypothetical protein